MLPLLADERWFLVATRGSHRRFKHPPKPGESLFLASQATNALLGHSIAFESRRARRGEGNQMRYAIVIESAGPNYSADVPDLPGCVATGATVEEVEREIRDAIEFTLRACAKMVPPFPRQLARFGASTYRPDPAVERTRRYAASTWRAPRRRAARLFRQASMEASGACRHS